MKQQFESVRSGFLLLLAAFIWGIAFVAQSVGMDYMGPAEKCRKLCGRSRPILTSRRKKS